MQQKFWHHKTFYFCAVWLIVFLCGIRIFYGFQKFEHFNEKFFLGDFFHMLSHVQFFLTGEDYSQWHPNPNAYNADYPPVFPGVTLFFLPFVWMNVTMIKILVMAMDISVPFFMVYIISKYTGTPFTWRVWSPSKKSLITLILFMLLLFTRPIIHSFMLGQITSLVIFVTYFSLFSFTGWTLGFATALKFSVPLLYFPLLLCIKKYKDVMKGILVFIFFTLFPIFYYHDIWNLYLSYAMKIHQHFNEANLDVFAGCQKGCELLLEMGWFKDDIFNILVKGFLLVLLLYGYWKTWTEGRYGLHTLLLTGGVTVLMTYHRIYDGTLLIVPLLMILIIHFKRKEWKMGIFPALIYAYYLIPSRVWLQLCLTLGSLFVDNPWLFFASPSHIMSFPLDGLTSVILVLFAIKRIWCGEEIYFLSLDKPTVGAPGINPRH